MNVYLNLLSVLIVLKYIDSGLGEQGGNMSKIFGWMFKLKFVGSMMILALGGLILGLRGLILGLRGLILGPGLILGWES